MELLSVILLITSGFPSQRAIYAGFDIDDLVQDCSNSSALAMELLQSCPKPSILSLISLNILDAVTYTEHAKRKTVTAMDVVYALKLQGRTLYGFGGMLRLIKDNIDGLGQDCSNSSALAMELLQSCTKPSILSLMLASTNVWTNSRVAGDLTRHGAHVSDCHCNGIMETQWFGSKQTTLMYGVCSSDVAPSNRQWKIARSMLGCGQPAVLQHHRLQQLISPWTKWPPFRRRYFQMHFREWKVVYFD